MAPHTRAPELKIPGEALDSGSLSSSIPQGLPYHGDGAYENDLAHEDFSFANDNIQDHSYYDFITNPDDAGNSGVPFDLQVPQYYSMQRHPSCESNHTVHSHISSGTPDKQKGRDGNNVLNENSSPDIDIQSASKTERRRAQNREAQRAFRTRRSHSVQMASQKLRDSLIEIRGLRHQKEIYEHLTQQQAARIIKLEKEIETMKTECVCRIWAPSLNNFPASGSVVGGHPPR